MYNNVHRYIVKVVFVKGQRINGKMDNFIQHIFKCLFNL